MGSRHHAENTTFDCQACILKGIFLLPNKLKNQGLFFSLLHPGEKLPESARMDLVKFFN